MYNENVKREYLKSKENPLPYEYVFEAISKYEEEWQADICTRSEEDIQMIIDDIVGLRAISRVRVSLLKDYVQWCIENGVPGACNGMLTVNKLGVSKILSQMVSSPSHLQKYLNSLFVPEGSCTVDCIYRCYLWLAYGGMSESDIMLVKTTDVDFDNMVVRFNGVEYPIYQEAYITLKICAESRIFIYINPKGGKDIIYTRMPGNMLLRGYKAAASYKTIRSEISRHSKDAIISGKTKQSVSYFRAWLSGIFYRMYEAELQGMPVNFTYTAERFMEGKNFSLSGRNTLNGKRNQIAKEYLADYQRWKSAYYSDAK